MLENDHGAKPMIKKDYNIDVLRLLDNLNSLAEKPRSFVGLTVGYNRQEFQIQIDRIKGSLPRDVKDASNLLRETERVMEAAEDEASRIVDQGRREAARAIEEANQEANRILEHARVTQETMISESEVLKLSKSQAEELRRNAENEAAMLRREADQFAYQTLDNLEAVVSKVMSSVERGRAELDRPKSPPNPVVKAMTEREGVSV
jgi:cell division septum initiation protein DivIVA